MMIRRYDINHWLLFFCITRQSGHKDPGQNQAGSEDPEAAVQGDLQHGKTTPPQRHTPLWGSNHTLTHIDSLGNFFWYQTWHNNAHTLICRWWRRCQGYTWWWSTQGEESSTLRLPQRGNSPTPKARSSSLRSCLLLNTWSVHRRYV